MANYFVSPTGNATWNQATTELNPCSWQSAMANAVADDIVYFRGGTYDVGVIGSQREYANMRPVNSGTAGHPITFKAYPGEIPNITGTVNSSSTAAYFGCSYVNYVTWDGFAATLAIYPDNETQTWHAWGSNYCTLKNSNFTGVEQTVYRNTSFVRVESSNNTLIENNYFHDLTGTTDAVNTAGIWVFGGSPIGKNTTVKYNTFRRVKAGCSAKTAATDISFYNNFVDNSYASNSSYDGFYIGYQGTAGSTNIKVYQNVFIGSNSGVRLAGILGDIVNPLIYNNIIYVAGTENGIHITGRILTGEVFNNVIVNTLPFLRYYTTPETNISYSNNNIFYKPTSTIWNLDYATNYFSLSAWTTATGFDADSYVEDPQFANPGGSNPWDYKINAPHKNSGRGGSYASVMGAYITGDEIIGYVDPRIITIGNNTRVSKNFIRYKRSF